MGEILFFGLVGAAFYSIYRYNPYIRFGAKQRRARVKRKYGRR